MSAPLGPPAAEPTGPRPGRVLLCLGGNQPRAPALAAALDAHPGLTVAGEPVSLAALRARLRGEPVELAIVAGHLPGLDDLLAAPDPDLPPLLILTRRADDARRRARPGVAALPLDAPTAAIVAAAAALARGAAPPPFVPSPAAPAGFAPGAPDAAAGPIDPAADAAEPAAGPGGGRVVAFLGTGGSGATTAVIEAGAALRALGPTALVDLNLWRPSLCVVLGLPLERNLTAVARDDPATPAAWDAALGREAARLDGPLRGLDVLAGLPHPAARDAVTPAFLGRLVAALRARYDHVLLDVGDDLLSRDPAAEAHRQALRLADRIVLTLAPDYLPAYRLRGLLEELTGRLGAPADRLELLVVGAGGGAVVPADEIEEEVGALPIAAWIPFDRVGALEARRQQRPLALAAPGPAASAYKRYAAGLAKRLGSDRRPAAATGGRRWPRR